MSRFYSLFKNNDCKIEDLRFSNREAEQIGTKLVNWESVKDKHNPSVVEIFQREHGRESELAREREEQHRQNKQEEGWKEVKLPEGTERSPE